MIVAAQVRAARALLGWSQDDLATRSDISHRTLAMFEVGRSVPHDRTLIKIEETLENAGIVFLRTGSEVGVMIDQAQVDNV